MQDRFRFRFWDKEVNTHEVIDNIYENPELLEV